METLRLLLLQMRDDDDLRNTVLHHYLKHAAKGTYRDAVFIRTTMRYLASDQSLLSELVANRRAYKGDAVLALRDIISDAMPVTAPNKLCGLQLPTITAAIYVAHRAGISSLARALIARGDPIMIRAIAPNANLEKIKEDVPVPSPGELTIPVYPEEMTLELRCALGLQRWAGCDGMVKLTKEQLAASRERRRRTKAAARC